MNEILISGGGMIGLSAACALAQQGFSVTLIESQSHTPPSFPELNAPYDLRVVAINAASQQFLSQIGVWPLVASSRYGRYEHMQVWDSVADGQIAFSAAHTGTSTLGYIVEQSVLLSAMWQKAQQTGSIRIMQGCQITQRVPSSEITVQLSQGSILSAQLLLIAEGAHSPLRSILGFETRTKPYDQTAVVATLKSTKSHHCTAFQRFSPEGPLAWLPLSDPHFTSIVWTTSPAEAQRLCALSAAEFTQQLWQESEDRLGAFTLESDRRSFVLQRQHALQYGRDRAVLLGDSAHTIHPLAGQGVNLGFRDVQILVDNLIAAKNQSRDIGSDRVIQRYQRKARGHNQIMLAAMDVFKQGFGSRNPWISGLRNTGLNWVDKQSGLKRWFIRAAQGVL